MIPVVITIKNLEYRIVTFLPAQSLVSDFQKISVSAPSILKHLLVSLYLKPENIKTDTFSCPSGTSE